ncbi:hypothetical protein RN001_000529 [Aquatica leii]|uniref:PID domain-containing protein n=1 Tax=Aquatica leii TaxID=1421715 RepID=A0AAN7PFF7_9COLE|nr:hypothetical protein RN001_000529 [Aquatica leii]
MSISNDKNETSRFLGEGVSFKAKLIGILEVSEARGDRMCQEALSDLKMAIRAAGEHKQRITINIAIDGLRLRDEKTGDSLYHHPVHKISFIAQDMTDSRAFGYIFGSPDTGHRFFGIKTDKAASQVVIAMRDLFQVVFALKKKEIELAKQHLDKNRYASSSIFSESAMASAKVLAQDSSNKTSSEGKAGATTEVKADAPAVADLVDLELELNSLQQGITQMERITPSDPFGSKDDPFGDSFTSYPPKPILPPPPSARERSNRTSESSNSIFSPKTPRTIGSVEESAADVSLFSSERNFSFSHDLSSSREEATSGDWFQPNNNDKVFDEPPLVPEPTKDQHELTKQEILSQFDVFTELDPLGMSTGKIKPYIDKKDFFQELKNPPKKVLKDLVSEKQPQETKLFQANFDQISTTPKLNALNGSGVFNADPFGEDPFDKTDPFAETEFSRQDPFESETFGAEFKMLNKDVKPIDFAEKLKFPTLNSSETMFTSKFSKSPNKMSGLEKQMSLVNQPIKTVQFNKQNTFDDKIISKISQIHENRSLDMSSESECAPEPPPRPTANLFQIKPPPLPPKKQPGDLCTKPPPRPPYSEESHYDYMDNYETGHTSLEFNKKLDKSPPLPAPARKVKIESDYTTPPQRPKKQFNLQQGWSSEEDYLTPISFPNQNREFKSVARNAGPILLPPPQKHAKKNQPPQENVTVASFLESESNLTTTNTQEKLTSLEGLDITLSQLTLSGLNEVATKLNIPASQLSNMTLVQLTEYISNFIKNKTQNVDNSVSQLNDFKADFSNFNNFNEEPHDKYAVFRELLQEEIKQTKIDTEPEEHLEERKKEEEKVNNLDVEIINKNNEEKTDRYAALRDIVVSEINQTMPGEESVEENNVNEAETKNENDLNDTRSCDDTKIKNENIINSEKLLEKEKAVSPKDEVIEYTNNKQDSISTVPIKSPIKVKSPIPTVVSDVIQTNNRLTSGSLSDVVSGSSPEVDNNGSNSDVKKATDATGESWAIFDQPNLSQQVSRDKQSEEGISPWSSDSKEFGNGSPPDWRQRTDSGSGAERWASGKKDQEGWWDTSAEPEVQHVSANRRSTDSYEEEGEFYDRPPRRRRQMAWSSHGGPSQAAGGHSSSSRDASPWEEEPRRRERDIREHRDTWTSRHSRQQHSFERQRDRRHADSWDEEDDYEYDEEHSGRYHWPERHSREPDKERHIGGMRDRDSERWPEEWNESRRHRRRRDTDRDRWCCPDWEQDLGYSNANRWRERKHEEMYYSRESQESPWEEEYNNVPDESAHSRYLMANKRNWKRPSSASETDRKPGETKSRSAQYYVGTGGSDGERDRRYKVNRRSKSRDSQFSEITVQSRYKVDPNLTLRGPYRNKPHVQKSPIEGEFSHDFSSKKLEISKMENKRSSTLGNRKKSKDPKTEQLMHTFPRKATFENNFIPSETESPMSANISPRFTFDNDFETSEAESPIALKCSKRHTNFDNGQPKMKRNLRYDTRKTTFKGDNRISPSRSTQRSPFEDDFSPSIEKPEIQLHKNISKSSIKEEMDDNENGEEDSFATNNFDKNVIRKKILNKNRYSSSFHMDSNLKKSESVNIFARESDPFDDEFFSGSNLQDLDEADKSPRSSDHKWTENFEDYDFENRK